MDKDTLKKFYSQHKKDIHTAYSTKYADRTDEQQNLIRAFSDMYKEVFDCRPVYKKDLQVLENKPPMRYIDALNLLKSAISCHIIQLSKDGNPVVYRDTAATLPDGRETHWYEEDMETLVHELMWDTNAQDLLKNMMAEITDKKTIETAGKSKKEYEHEI